MKKFKMVAAATVVSLGLIGCAGINPATKTLDIKVPVSQLNDSMQKQFPQSQSMKYGKVTISEADILGQSGSNTLSVGTGFSFTPKIIPSTLKGAVKLSSGVRYNATDKSLYLANPTVEDIRIQNFSLANVMTSEIKQAIGLLISETIAKKPIYDLSSRGMATKFIKSVNVENGNVVVGMGL